VAPRAYWKGYLKLSLVSCPIALYPATGAADCRQEGQGSSKARGKRGNATQEGRLA
jgi:hypothetical protein